MIRENSKNGGENPTEIPRRNRENHISTSLKNRRGKHVELSVKNGGENSSSKEEVGVCYKKHTLPPFVHEEAPHPVDTLSFFIDFDGRNPPTVTHQMHRVTVRNGKPQFFDSPALAKARADICARLEAFSPDAPFEGPVALCVSWLFRDSRGREGWKDTKPDTDNLQKLLKDCMTRMRFWIDDAQVVAEHVFKRWSLKPGIVISITQL